MTGKTSIAQQDVNGLLSEAIGCGIRPDSLWSNYMSVTNLPEIVMLPGMDGTAELLKDVSDRLSAHRRTRVIAYPTQRAMNYDQLTALVEELVPNEPFVILGESFSGPIAIEIAARKKNHVAGLVLAATFAKHPMPAPFSALARAFNHTWIPRYVSEAALLGSKGTPEIRTALAEALSKVSSNVIRMRIIEALQVDMRSTLKEIVCPTLCLTGQQDRLVGRGCANAIRSALADCEIQVLDAPHMLLQTNASEAADIIARFGARVLPSQRR